MNQYVTGAVIKRLREEKNMTQQQLADKLSGQCKDNFQMGNSERISGYHTIRIHCQCIIGVGDRAYFRQYNN